MISVLDHGYVSIVESWGSDERIIEAARMSTQKGFEGWGPRCKQCRSTRFAISDGRNAVACRDAELNSGAPAVCVACGAKDREAGDERLLAYLYRNNHSTPFEMAGLVIEVQAPIFVFREWHRHRTQSYNEMSARYAPLPDINYLPSIERVMANASTSNKQAGTIANAGQLSEEDGDVFRNNLRAVYNVAEQTYQEALQRGVPKELARCVLPVARYSRMRASANLRNWLAFLTLRMAPQAQWEIREYASAVHELLTPHFPRTLALFNERSGA